MKITLVTFLFLVIFALAASSTPVPPVQAHPLQAPSTRVELGSTVTYTINGNQYTKKDIYDAAVLLEMTEQNKASPPPEVLAKAEMLSIEGTRLDITEALRLGTDYDEMRRTLHHYMLSLIDALLPDIALTDDQTVLSLARNALQTCLGWETENRYTYADSHPVIGRQPSLSDLQYLRALKIKILSFIPGDTSDSDTEMEPPPQHVSDKRKRRASDILNYKSQGANGNSGGDNGHSSKMRRLSGSMDRHDGHGDEIHMTG
ncbi:hypothetical protein H0H93_009828 [Arthromyces matolae]|nr:hypothetical protein H0H93_009828 [Arthromyces matolae]